MEKEKAFYNKLIYQKILPEIKNFSKNKLSNFNRIDVDYRQFISENRNDEKEYDNFNFKNNYFENELVNLGYTIETVLYIGKLNYYMSVINMPVIIIVIEKKTRVEYNIYLHYN